MNKFMMKIISLYVCIILLVFLNDQLHANKVNQIKNTTTITSLLEKALDAERKNDIELALKYYNKILIINPNNKKAISRITEINKKEKKLNLENYQQTANLLIDDVDKSWEISKNNSDALDNNENSQLQTDFSDSKNTLISKLSSIIISQISLENVPLPEAIDYLKQKSIDYDNEKKGINIVLNLKLEEKKSTANSSSLLEKSVQPHISLDLKQVPIRTALEYLAKQANLAIRIDPYAVVLLSDLEEKKIFFNKEYIIKSNSIFGIDYNTNIDPSNPLSAKNYLQHQGITFPEGSFANYSQENHKLLLHNTKENIDLADFLLSTCNYQEPLQISIETKFIEVTQDQFEKLGINSILKGLQIGNSGIYLNTKEKSDSPGSLNSSTSISEIQSVHDLNSENQYLEENSIDTAIERSSSSHKEAEKMAGIFGITGVYNNAQLEVTLQALQRKKGVNLMAAPHVTTKDGVQAIVKIIDEFIYPTEYSPPQIPQSTTNSGERAFYTTPPTITPSFPNTWTTKNLGVILEAKPTIAPDGYSIELELHPQITDFDGFINYGSPINTVGYSSLGTNINTVPFSSTLTTNTINQPVFTVREVHTSVTVWDGQTVVLGGLIREDIQKFNDKIPLLSSIPLAGKLFKYQVDKKIKKNLIIFVTPRILNQNGNLLHQLHSKKNNSFSFIH